MFSKYSEYVCCSQNSKKSKRKQYVCSFLSDSENNKRIHHCHKTQTSKMSSPTKKSGFVQPGCVVDGHYGPFETSSSEVTRRRRSVERGAVLRSHSQHHWLVHWFSIGKTAFVPFNMLKVVKDASPLSAQHVQDLLRDNRADYLGGSNELRAYFDSYSTNAMKKRSSASVTPSPPSAKKLRHVPQSGKHQGDESECYVVS